MNIQSVHTSPAELSPPAAQTPVASPPPVTVSADPPPSTEQLQQAAKAINEAVKQLGNSNVEFSVDEGTGITIARVVDGDSHEVIRQIPSQELVDIARNLDRMMSVLIRDKA